MLSLAVFAQGVKYLEPVDVKGADLIILPSVRFTPKIPIQSNLSFFNPKTTSGHESKLPPNYEIKTIQQVEIDKLELNKILVIAQNRTAPTVSTAIMLFDTSGNLLFKIDETAYINKFVVNEHSGMAVFITENPLKSPDESYFVVDLISGHKM